jgi:hypothetical protein
VNNIVSSILLATQSWVKPVRNWLSKYLGDSPLVSILANLIVLVSSLLVALIAIGLLWGLFKVKKWLSGK